MELIPILATVSVGGIASLVMSWLEGRRLRKPRASDEIADDAAAVVAQEAVDVIAVAEHPIAEGVDEAVPRAPDGSFALGDRASIPSPPPTEAVPADTLTKEIGDRLAKDEQFRAALGIKKKTAAVWVMQGLVSAALLGVSVYSFATNTETGVGFAFCGSLGGFWMREITA